MQGGVGGAVTPHRANGAERARRPKADKEGQGAEGSSEAGGRLEGQRGNLGKNHIEKKQRESHPGYIVVVASVWPLF